MADKMAAKLALGLLPSAERLGRGRQSCVHPKIVEQPVGIEFMEILPVPFHRLSERAVEEADILEGKSTSEKRNCHPLSPCIRAGQKISNPKESRLKGLGVQAYSFNPPHPLNHFPRIFFGSLTTAI
jgi:hypothetical protein